MNNTQQRRAIDLTQALSDVPTETRALFKAYHAADRTIWDKFEEAAMELIHSNEHVGSKAIAEMIRRKASREGKEFGIDNRFLACYGRIFVYVHPQYRHLFEFRTVKGITQREAA